MHPYSIAYPAAPGQEEVDRVICASRASERANVYSTMETIRECALRHNPPVGIHTALLYQSGWYLHWAEGPRDPVGQLFGRVAKDGRHFARHVVHASTGRRLLMTPFSMMLSPALETANAFGERVMALREQLRAGTQIAPTAVIRRLMMPLLLPEAQQLHNPESYHRVIVCSAAGQSAFELTRWLSEDKSVPKASRRLAGHADLDSASEYVEFMRGEQICRVIAIARSSLTQGLHRSLAPDWHFLVLLFSGDAKRNEALLDRIQQTFEGLPRTPILLAVAPNATTKAHVVKASLARGLACETIAELEEHDSEAIWQAVDAHVDACGPPVHSTWPVFDPSPAARNAQQSQY